MSYLIEILCDLISRDYDFFSFYSKNYESLFYLWDIESEADDAEIETLIKKGIISRDDGNILKTHRRQIMLDIQTIINNAEELKLPKRESIKMVWRTLRKYGLSDDYIKLVIRDLYSLL